METTTFIPTKVRTL